MIVLWELRYDRTVTALLYSLRGTEVGSAIHEAIKALQFEENPAQGREQIVERANRYQFVVHTYQIRIEVIRGERKVIRILSVTQKLSS